MAIGDVVTDATSIAVRVQNDIYLQSIIPLAYCTPTVMMMDNEPLRKRGKTLQHQYLVEQDEFADASSYELTTIATNDTVGVEEITYGKKTFDISKKVKSHIITDLAKYHDLGDISDDSGAALRNSAARTINSLVYDALLASAGGLMWLRQDGDTNSQKAGLLVDSSAAVTTIVCDELTEADDYWNGAQVTFESGKNVGQTFTVSDWVQSTNTLTVSTMPYVATANDKFRICQPGYTDESSASAISTNDTPTIRAIVKNAARCRIYGAASPMAAGAGGFTYDRAGIRRVISPSIANGVIFLHEFLMQEMMENVSSTDVQANQALWQSDEGFSRIVGGGLRRLYGMLWVPINHHKRRAVADGTLANGSGDLWPVLIMYKGCALSTRLRDAPGDNLGLVFNTKIPGRNDIANKYDSIKMQNEAYMHNAFGGKNSLHGCVHWCSTSMT
jgi:hypothetical protein